MSIAVNFLKESFRMKDYLLIILGKYANVSENAIIDGLLRIELAGEDR